MNVQPEAPHDRRIYAVGDIHGRVDLMRALHSRIAADAARINDARANVVIYVGDYIDRGDHSRQVVETLIGHALAGFEQVCLSGNHERLLLQFLADPDSGPTWLFNGGDATLRSYGVDIEDPAFGLEGWSWVRQRLLDGLPGRHLAFFRELPLSHEEGDYFFVHAGVRPGVALDRQNETDLLWIREEFYHSRADFGKVIVHGHSISETVDVQPNRIGIDTGAYGSGVLSCLVLEDAGRRILQT
jgi:serine/threonine protein phosphatase 1